MRTIIRKWGNSLALRIPKSLLDENNIFEGNELKIYSEDGKIILEPEVKTPRQGWELAAKQAYLNEDDKLLMDFSTEFEGEEWTW